MSLLDTKHYANSILKSELVDKNVITPECLTLIGAHLTNQADLNHEPSKVYSDIEHSVFIQDLLNSTVDVLSVKSETIKTIATDYLVQIAATILNCYILKDDREQLDYLVKAFGYGYPKLPVGEVVGTIQHALNEINSNLFRGSDNTSLFLPVIFVLCCNSISHQED